jgi:hypothetical protein
LKRIVASAILLALVLTLSACAGGYTSLDADALSASLSSADIFEDELVLLSEANTENNTGIDPSLCSEIEFYMGPGATGEEYGIFTCNSEADAKKVYTALEEHKTWLYDTYATYNTEALPRIENATLVRAGKYVAYVSARDYDDAAELVTAALVK